MEDGFPPCKEESNTHTDTVHRSVVLTSADRSILAHFLTTGSNASRLLLPSNTKQRFHMYSFRTYLPPSPERTQGYPMILYSSFLPPSPPPPPRDEPGPRLRPLSTLPFPFPLPRSWPYPSPPRLVVNRVTSFSVRLFFGITYSDIGAKSSRGDSRSGGNRLCSEEAECERDRERDRDLDRDLVLDEPSASPSSPCEEDRSREMDRDRVSSNSGTAACEREVMRFSGT